MSHPFIDFESNTLDTMRILEAIRRFNITCRYLHISSAAVYGNPEALPVNEDTSKLPLSPYGWHKLMAELICQEYNGVYKLPTASVRPFSVYGPGLKKQLFWDIFQKAKINPKRIELWGTGKETRDFIYIDDLTYCISIIIEKAQMVGEVYNIASGEESTIKSAVEFFFNCMGWSTQMTFNNNVREGDPLNWQADIKKIVEMGFVPGTSLKQGLIRLSEWLKAVE
jgi:dTDP-glucose 4,6-dehydratase/UDP-glucose 4-epimerase